jgi:hypothetical protein
VFDDRKLAINDIQTGNKSKLLPPVKNSSLDDFLRSRHAKNIPIEAEERRNKAKTK